MCEVFASAHTTDKWGVQHFGGGGGGVPPTTPQVGETLPVMQSI